MIKILLAAYNGAGYISGQIESVLSQTEQDFALIIRDDRSTDETVSVVSGYAARYPGKIILQENAVNSGSAGNNFLNLMAGTRGEYIMLCDQDDVWLPGKIEKSLAKMRELEALYGKETPLLVHTDLRVADGELNELSPSLERYMNADFSRREPGALLVQNSVTGCTALYNGALAELLREEPPFAVIHDWWLALVAALFGEIGYIPEPTVIYRQHGRNAIGAADARSPGYILGRLLSPSGIKASINRTYPQARSLLTLYRDRLSPEQAAFLEAYAAIPGQSKPGRLKTVFRLKAFKHGFARNAAYLFFL